MIVVVVRIVGRPMVCVVHVLLCGSRFLVGMMLVRMVVRMSGNVRLVQTLVDKGSR